MSGLLAAHRLRQAGVAVRDLREERRRRRHLAGEHLSRLPGRRARTTTTATRSPSATTGRSTSRRSPSCSTTSARAPTSSASASTSASTPRSSSDRFDDEAAARGRVETVEPGRPAEAAHGRRGDQRRRPAQPAEAARHRGARRRFAGPVVPLRASGTTTSTSPASASASSAPGAARRSSSPIIAEQVDAALTIFQRTPNWLFPTPHYHDDVPAGHPVAARPRARTTASGTASGCSGATPRAPARRPRSTRPGTADGARSARPTTSCASCSPRTIEAQFGDRPDLLDEGAAAVPAGGQADHPSTTASGPRRCSATTSS